MDKQQMIKTAGEIVLSVGIGAIVANSIKATTPATDGVFKKLCIGAGSLVITNMVSEKVIDYAEVKIKKMIEAFKGEDIIDVEAEVVKEEVNVVDESKLKETVKEMVAEAISENNEILAKETAKAAADAVRKTNKEIVSKAINEFEKELKRKPATV